MEESWPFHTTSNKYEEVGEYFYIECHYALKLKVVLALPFHDPKENQLIEMHQDWWFSMNYFQEGKESNWAKEAFCKRTSTQGVCPSTAVCLGTFKLRKSWKTLLGQWICSPEKGMQRSWNTLNILNAYFSAFKWLKRWWAKLLCPIICLR